MSKCVITILCATILIVSSAPGHANGKEKRVLQNEWPAHQHTNTPHRSDIVHRQRRQSWQQSASGNWNNEGQNNDVTADNQNSYETSGQNQNRQPADLFYNNSYGESNQQSSDSSAAFNRKLPPEPTSEGRYDSQYNHRPPPPPPDNHRSFDRGPPPHDRGPSRYDRGPPPRQYDRWDDRPPPPPPPPSRYYEGKPPHDRGPPPHHSYDYYSYYDRRPPPPPPPDRDRYERDDHWGFDRGRDYHRRPPYDRGPPPPPPRDWGPPPHHHGGPPPPPPRDWGPPRHDGGPPPHHHGGPPPYDRGPPPRDRGPPPRDRGPPPRNWGPPPRDEGPPDHHRGPPPRDREESYMTSPNSSSNFGQESRGSDSSDLNLKDSSTSYTYDQRPSSLPRDNSDTSTVTDKVFDIDTRFASQDTSTVTSDSIIQDLNKSRYPPLFQVIPVTPEG